MELTARQVETAARLCCVVYNQKPDYLFVKEGGTQYIAFEGSDTAKDWRRNLEFLIVDHDEHLGFALSARDLMSQMWLDGIQLDKDKPLVLCGHSLGGAVATIIAAQLQEIYPEMVLVTFGSPRPGGRKFRERFKVQHWRYVHENDVVPALPPAMFGYRHTGPATRLGLWAASHLIEGAEDHSCEAYRDHLRLDHANGSGLPEAITTARL